MTDYRLGVNTPVYPSVTFGFEDAHRIAEVFSVGLPDGEYLYGRFGHPNYIDLCVRLAHMEGGEKALVFASGISATFTLFFAKLSVGDHIVVSSRIYGGTRGQLAMFAHKLRLKVSVVDVTDHAAVLRACRKQTKIVYAESVSNPEAVVTDVAALSRICRKKSKEALLVIDNTFTPLIMRPLALGADVVMHSLTKSVSGRSDVMGGALIGSAALMDALQHPLHGEASLVGALLHPPVAQELAERFYQIQDRVREGSLRARLLGKLFVNNGLRAHYPTLEQSRPAGARCGLDGKEMGGAVLSVEFPTEVDGVRFVNAMKGVVIDDPLLGPTPLAIAAVSLGSSHTYVWCTTEARAQSKSTKWPALPFSPVPFGFVRIAVGYAGDRNLVLLGFAKVLCELGYQSAPDSPFTHT